MAMISTLLTILSQKRYMIIAALVFLVYIVIYLSATQFLILTQRMEIAEEFFMIRISENWPELMFRQRAPFLFEAIGVIYIGGLKLFISIPNLILATGLGFLVALNLAVSYYSFRMLGLRGARGLTSLVGTVPAILSGAVCCVPTIILVIGLQLTATLTTAWSFFVPLSFVLLIAALWWALRKIEKEKWQPAH